MEGSYSTVWYAGLSAAHKATEYASDHLYQARDLYQTTFCHLPSEGQQIVLSIALICTARRRIPTSASTRHGPEKGDFV